MHADRMSIILIALTSLPCVVVGDELPTVEAVRQHLREWRQDFVVFRIRYEVGEAGSSAREVRDFTMTDTRNYTDASDWFFPDKTPTRDVRGGNSNLRFKAGYTSPDDGQTWTLNTLREDDRKTSNIGSAKILTPMLLLFDPYYGHWMDEYLFSKHDVQVLGREVVGGESCIALNVAYKDENGVDGNGSKIWLAENKSFLVKQITPNEGPPTGRLDPNYLCEQFRQHEGRWYPDHGTLLLAPEQSQWKVIAFEQNPIIKPERFRPPSKSGLVARSGRKVSPKIHSSEAPNVTGLPDAVPNGIGPALKTGLAVLVLGFIALIAWWKSKTAS